MISIILPTYNRDAFLKRSINSVLGQSYTDWELIIIDDGSTDETKSVIATFNDFRIKKLLNSHNRERSYSRNRAIAEAKGEYICFLDSDDEWRPEHLLLHAKAWAEAEDNIGIHLSWFMREKNGVQKLERLPEQNKFNSNAEFVLLNQPAIMTWSIRANLLRKIQFDERLHINEDVVLLTKLAASHQLKQIPQYTAVYHMHDSNTHQEGRDTISPQIHAMKILFDDANVRETVSFSTRNTIMRNLRHYRVAFLYKWGSKVALIFAVLMFLLRYPRDRQNQPKVCLLLNKLPIMNDVGRVKRAANAVIKNYY